MLSYNAYYTEYATQFGRHVSVRHALLALLSEGPKYGLRLREEFEERTGEVWPLNVGQVLVFAVTTSEKGRSWATTCAAKAAPVS